MSSDKPDDLLTLKEAETLAGISASTLRRWRREYPVQLPTRHRGRTPMVSQADLLATAELIGAPISVPGGDERPRPVMTGHDRSQAATTGHDRSQPETTGDDRSRPAMTGHDRLPTGEASVDIDSAVRIAELEEQVRALSIQLAQARESHQLIGASLTDRLVEMTERDHSTTALQLRSNAQRELAEQAAALLEEQVEDLRKGQATLATQVDARIDELKASHARELATLQASLDRSLAEADRARAETDRLVTAGVQRDHQLAAVQAELAAYRAWAAKGSLGRALSKPALPEVPRALPGPVEPGEG